MKYDVYVIAVYKSVFFLYTLNRSTAKYGVSPRMHATFRRCVFEFIQVSLFQVIKRMPDDTVAHTYQ